MKAEILAIGDELLSGETVDTNSSHLDGLLESWGWTVVRHVTVADDVEAIADAFVASAARCQLVLSTGGLGPTQDDLTLEALARALGCALVLHEPTVETIRARFAAFGRTMTPNNLRQAMVPERGEVITNDVGTAPSFTAELSGARIYLMPGVPREMRWLMENRIGPQIPRGDVPIARRTIQVMGLGESRLEHSILEVVKAHPDVRFGYRTAGVENHVKLLARGEGRIEALDRVEGALREVLGDRVFGTDGADLVALVVRDLIARGRTLAVAESCTGGELAKEITDVSGCSATFLGGVVAYANAAKIELLGVDPAAIEAHGAVSEAVAIQMADGVRKRLGADYALSTTGIAGPDGGTPEKPVGTVWMALSGPEGTEARMLRFPGERHWVRTGSAKAAVDLLRGRLAGSNPRP